MAPRVQLTVTVATAVALLAGCGGEADAGDAERTVLDEHPEMTDVSCFENRDGGVFRCTATASGELRWFRFMETDSGELNQFP